MARRYALFLQVNKYNYLFNLKLTFGIGGVTFRIVGQERNAAGEWETLQPFGERW